MKVFDPSFSKASSIWLVTAMNPVPKVCSCSAPCIGHHPWSWVLFTTQGMPPPIYKQVFVLVHAAAIDVFKYVTVIPTITEHSPGSILSVYIWARLPIVRTPFSIPIQSTTTFRPRSLAVLFNGFLYDFPVFLTINLHHPTVFNWTHSNTGHSPKNTFVSYSSWST